MTTLDLADQLHRYSVDEYEELVLKGAFEDQRVELIDGLILDMSPKSPAHESAVRWLTEWLILSVDRRRYQVGVCGSIRLALSEPEPDLAVIDRDLPRDRHPTNAHLVIEVAPSSRERDLTIKPRLYAPAVSEYWVLDLEQRHIVVHRDPAQDRYRDVSIHAGDATLRPERLELDPLPLGELLAAIGSVHVRARPNHPSSGG